jgi:inner membrane protein
MYLFGHLGLTLGAAAVGANVYDLMRRGRSGGEPADSGGAGKLCDDRQKSSRLTWDRLGKWLDVRLLLLGSMLPDLIDKPLGYLYLNSGRTISHTLLFGLLSLAPLIYFHKPGQRRWLVALSVGVFAHLFFDEMWSQPVVLFWPIYGTVFPLSVSSKWLYYWITTVFHVPSLFLPELLGMSIVLAFTVSLVRRRTVKAFIRKGVF